MYSKIKIAGHPIHPMLIAYPIAFYTATLVCFIVYNSNADVFWFKAAYVANAAGVVMAIVAALPGFIDWLGIPSSAKPKKTGLLHMICNILALLLFGVCFLLQKDKWAENQPILGFAYTFVSRWIYFNFNCRFFGMDFSTKTSCGC